MAQAKESRGFGDWWSYRQPSISDCEIGTVRPYRRTRHIPDFPPNCQEKRAYAAPRGSVLRGRGRCAVVLPPQGGSVPQSFNGDTQQFLKGDTQCLGKASIRDTQFLNGDTQCLGNAVMGIKQISGANDLPAKFRWLGPVFVRRRPNGAAVCEPRAAPWLLDTPSRRPRSLEGKRFLR